MASIELIMPKMGESIMEATILKWLKNEGDTIAEEEAVLEIATDKVDSEVPSPVSGVLLQKLFAEGEVVPVGTPIALLTTDAIANAEIQPPLVPDTSVPVISGTAVSEDATTMPAQGEPRFYSPLVLNIARQEGISTQQLDALAGTGKDGRVTKNDILTYIANRQNIPAPIVPAPTVVPPPAAATPAPVAPTSIAKNYGDNVEIIEMDRMRRMIAEHMVMSKHTSPHVTSFIEVDVTPIVKWRNGIKAAFQKREGENITFTPIFVEVVAKALREFPWVNASVDGDKVILRKDINVGVAAALPSGNLIVPVVKNADRLNLTGLTKAVNDLANRARENKLKPEEIQGGTFTLSNIGSFGSVMGTPIINQPQVAILAVGAIRKKPVVLETEDGDVIAIRHMMMMSLSYDHRIIDGALGSRFLARLAALLESFDTKREG